MPRIKLRSKTRTPPKNRRIVQASAASQSIQHYTEIKQAEILNTLVPSGIHCHVYTRLTGGLPCTCDAKIPLLDVDGKLEPNTINQLLFQSSTTDRNTFVITDAPDEDRELREHGIETEMSADDDDFFFEESLLDYSSVSCPVCYGTGFVGGFDIINGFNVTLCSSNLNTSCRVDTTVNPNSIQGDGTPCTTTIVIPIGMTCYKAELYNNTDRITNWTLNSFPPTQQLLNSLSQGKPLNISIECTEEFTHLNLYYTDNNVINVDFGQLDTSTLNKDQLGSLGTANFILGANVPRLTQFSIIKDTKYNRYWQINNMTPCMTSNNRILYWDVEARLIQPNEITSNL